MEFIKEFKTDLRNELLALPAAAPMKDTHVMVRCPFCGDSIKSFDHGHLGIKIDFSDDAEPIVYNCLRCSESGMLTPKVLAELDIVDMDLNKNLTMYQARAKKLNFSSLVLRNGKGFNYQIPDFVTDVNLGMKKLNYLNQRLGVEEDFETYIKLGVVFNLAEFLAYNKIKFLTRPLEGDRGIRSLHWNYVGFLSTKKEFVINRNIGNNKLLRYDIYDMNKYKSSDVLTKMFFIKTHVDIMKSEPLHIHLAEGTFDILGVYFNIMNKETDHQIYGAVCGCGFKAGIKYIIDNGIFGDHVHFHIYSDKDKDPKFYTKLFKKLKLYCGSITLYYNEKEKDYGVPKERIRLVRTRIF